MRKDRSFDDIIKGKLDNVSPRYQPGNWERFRERLDQEQQAEASDIEFFDRVVRQKTPSVTHAGFTNNWATLISRLDLIYRRERDIALSKLLEMLALLLLFWIVDEHQVPQSSTFVAHSSQHVETNYQLSQWQSDQKVENDAFGALPSPERNQKPDTPISGDRIFSAQDLITQPAVSSVSSFPPVINVHPSGLDTYLVPHIEVHFPELVQSRLVPPALGMSENQPVVLADKLSHPKSSRLTLSMLGSTDINNVHTPGSIEGPFSQLDPTTFVIPALQRFAPGYGGGAAIGLDHGRFETEIGLLYTAKIYQARPVLYVTGSVSEGFSAEGLKDIELNMISVPFQLKYNLIEKNNWTIYTGLGASVNIVMESNFQLADEDAFRSSSFNLRLPDPNPTGVPKSRGLNAKNLEGGWLQGGGLANNTYITGTISAGLERRFNSGWSLFFQPTYQHSLYYFSKGIGPDKDRIHTFSLMSGIRIRL